MRRAAEMTLRDGKESSVTLAEIYRCEHSPMYTQWFWIEMLEIPTFVAKQLARHHVGGTVHFIMTGREDRGADGKADRWTPVNHGIMINAKGLVDMARKRLCNKAHASTIAVMKAIKRKVAAVDPDLAAYMVPECVYRGGCHELRPCGENVWYHYVDMMKRQGPSPGHSQTTQR